MIRIERKVYKADYYDWNEKFKTMHVVADSLAECEAILKDYGVPFNKLERVEIVVRVAHLQKEVVKVKPRKRKRHV